MLFFTIIKKLIFFDWIWLLDLAYSRLRIPNNDRTEYLKCYENFIPIIYPMPYPYSLIIWRLSVIVRLKWQKTVKPVLTDTQLVKEGNNLTEATRWLRKQIVLSSSSLLLVKLTQHSAYNSHSNSNRQESKTLVNNNICWLMYIKDTWCAVQIAGGTWRICTKS